MGQDASSLLKDQLKKDNADYQKLQDAVRSLHREIESENENFKQFVLNSGTEGQKFLPMTAMVKYKTFVDQKQTESVEGFSKKIQHLIDDTLENSSIGSAIAESLTLAAQAMLDNAVSSYTRKIGYCISLVLGGVQRVDYLLASRSFVSETWKQSLQDVVSGCIIVSSVDIQSLKKNDASVLIQNCFKGNGAAVQIAIRKLLLIETSNLPRKTTNLQDLRGIAQSIGR